MFNETGSRQIHQLIQEALDATDVKEKEEKIQKIMPLFIEYVKSKGQIPTDSEKLKALQDSTALIQLIEKNFKTRPIDAIKKERNKEGGYGEHSSSE